jgi:hypothetical protein
MTTKEYSLKLGVWKRFDNDSWTEVTEKETISVEHEGETVEVTRGELHLLESYYDALLAANNIEKEDVVKIHGARFTVQSNPSHIRGFINLEDTQGYKRINLK